MRAYVVFALVIAIGIAALAGRGRADSALAPEASPFITACNLAAAIGARENVLITHCRRVKEEVVGNVASVEVSVRAEGIGRFIFWTTMYRSEWASHAYTITSAP